MIILAYILSGLALLMGILLLIQTKMPVGWIVLLPKLIAGSLSPLWTIIGAVGAVIGWLYQAPLTILMGIVGAIIMIVYVVRCTLDQDGFEKVFGAEWSDQIPAEQARDMIKKRWTLFLKMKATSKLAWERDIPFWTIPGTDRQLLCDIWRPINGHVSGLAFIYFHGSGWYLSDKDVGTRPFFQHLVAQGHTVMDVAYRLCPEVDIYGMVGDVKRAIAWMKNNACRYGVNPEKIVLGGGSAGGHLALLAGYAPQHPELTPEDVIRTDLSVRGIISYYGPTDLLATYQHEDQQRIFAGMPTVPIGKKLESTKSIMRVAGRLDILLGGHPQEVPEIYQLASPITYVNPGCPATLLIQGNQDFVTPVKATSELYKKLVGFSVPAINVVFPWTDHAFDLLFPQLNPPAQSALYDVDRFLALLLNRD
jgi:acetyl esterase/lipase